MAIFTIGDLHLSLGTSKPMDIFSGWENYVERLRENWLAAVGPQDTVVLAGDTSWAMKLEDCSADFAFLQNLPGRKLLLKGNHDYWWTTMAKMNAYLAANGFDSLSFLHNNCVFAEGLALCGTRSGLRWKRREIRKRQCSCIILRSIPRRTPGKWWRSCGNTA